MNLRSGIRLMSRPMQSVNCEEIHTLADFKRTLPIKRPLSS